MIAANDAMTFIGVITQDTDLPDIANTGDTYKVGKAGGYIPIKDDQGNTISYQIDAKVGDLLINTGDDG
jgi:hypothetical protein